MANVEWHSPVSRSSNSVVLTPSVGSTPTIPPPTDTDFLTEQVHNILFHKQEDPAIKWEFLTTRAPFPITKVVENKAIVELLLTTEPGPKVDYDGLRANLTLLKPFVIKAPSGPSLLGFFKSLLLLKAGWVDATAKLEAFRSYDRTLFTYYVEWYDAFQQDTAARVLDEGEIAYERECREHAAARVAGTYVQQEEQLVKELEAKAINLVTFKTSQEMWKYSRILWTITEQYQCYKHKAKVAAMQKKIREEEMEKRKTEEVLRRREEVKKKNEEVRKRQMGMQMQQGANNLFMQQDWATNYATEP